MGCSLTFVSAQKHLVLYSLLLFFCKLARKGHLTYVAIGEPSEIFMKCKCDVIFVRNK